MKPLPALSLADRATLEAAMTPAMMRRQCFLCGSSSGDSA